MRRALPNALLLLCAILVSVEAQAEEPRLPVSVSARPLAIGRFNLLLGAEPGLTVGSTPSVYQVVLPLRFGITDDLELFAGPVAQSVDPNVHEPALGVLYRFVRGPVEIGARAAGDLSLFGAVRSATLQLGVPIRIHAGNILAIDVGAHALVSVLPQAGTFGLLVPAGVSINVIDALTIGAAGAWKLPSFASTSTFTVPLAATVGYTIAGGDRPFIDLAAQAGWNDVRTSFSAFTVGASAKLYLYF